MEARRGEGEKEGAAQPQRSPLVSTAATPIEPEAAEVLRELPGIVLVLERDWTVRMLNREAQTLLGSPSDCARGQNWFSAFVPEHNRDQVCREFEESLAQETAPHPVSLVRCADGMEHRIQWRLRKLESEKARGELVVALGTDITEREWKEEHRKLLSSMVEQSTEGMAVIDSRGSIIFINRACAEMHGYEALELIGEDSSLLSGKAREEEDFQVNEEIERKGQFCGELWHRRRGGDPFPVMAHVSRLKDDTGRVMGFVWTIRDLTEQKRAAGELRQSRERLRTVVDSAPVVLWAVDKEGRFTLSEGSGLRASGLAPAEAVGRSVFELYADNPKIQESVRRALAGENSAATVAVGDLVYDASYWPLRDERGEIIGAMGVATDVTQRAKSEEALRQRARQQTAVAQFGQQGVAGLDLDRLCEEAVSLVADNLDVEFAKVLELAPDGQSLLLRAGVGWKPGSVGNVRVSAGRDSQAGYTLLSKGPVIVEDLRAERRFSGPPFLHEHGVVSGMSVIIQGRDRPFGVLGAHTVKQRRFSPDDIHFLQALANVLAAAIERKSSEEAHARLAKAVEQTPESIIITDAEARIQYVNPAFERITGYTSQEVLGQNPRILKSGEHDESFYRQMWETLRARNTWRGYFVNKRKDGTVYREQATVSPVTDDRGRIVNYVAVKRDLSGSAGA